VSVAPILGALVLLLIVVGWCWWGFRTYRALWRRGTTPWSRLVYDYGVRVFGVISAVTWGVIAGYFGASGAATSGEALSRAIVVGVAVAIIVTPVCLGMGYMWGIWMAYFTGLERDETSAHSSPTPNNRWRGP
jgi:hypothetical protein